MADQKNPVDAGKYPVAISAIGDADGGGYNASGTAGVMELARLLAPMKGFPSSMPALPAATAGMPL